MVLHNELKNLENSHFQSTYKRCFLLRENSFSPPCSPVSCSFFQALWHIQFPDDPSFGRGDCWRLEVIPVFGRKHPQVPRSGEKTDCFISVSPFFSLSLPSQTCFTSSQAWFKCSIFWFFRSYSTIFHHVASII